MKLLIWFTFLGFASAIVYPYKWTQFKQNYNKTYSSLAEEIKRAKIYLNNVQLVNEHNKRYENGEVSFFLALNKFADLTLEEFKILYTGFKGSKHESGIVLTKVDDLPDSIDWRKKKIIAPIKDQGECGSCWAFSAVAAMEALHAQKSGQLIQLSEQNLIDCSTPEGDHGCNGGLMDNAFQYVINNRGIDTENAYPYDADDGFKCRFKNSTIGATIKSYLHLKAGDEYSLQIASIKGAVSVGIEVNWQFQLYAGGIFSAECLKPAELDHGVVIVGYASEGGKNFWIVRNSWGTNWGEKGYIRMLRGVNFCGISDAASYPIA